MSRFQHDFESHPPWIPRAGLDRIPGYSGFVPRKQFLTGKSFAVSYVDSKEEFKQVNHDLEKQKETTKPKKTDGKQVTSGNLGTDTRFESTKPWEGGGMVPGYTGHIPKKKYHQGQSFAATCALSLEEFKTGKTAVFDPTENQETFKRRVVNYATQISDNTRAPPCDSTLKLEGSTVMLPASLPMPKHHAELDLNPNYRLPGYTGYMPGTRDKIGASFATISRQMLNEPAPTLQAPPPPAYASTIAKKHAKTEDNRTGHLPGYTGYVPNSRNKYGITFGVASAP